ncbi:c-type cytochrome [Pontibacter vulgaris]|uniref:c-type cytochrome n=1 Tax=Pontibacter vulgaris TaxID=2905679 RepID=UPI001FA706A3|nr:cytochrome c [Pontibacter vulgaris]
MKIKKTGINLRGMLEGPMKMSAIALLCSAMLFSCSSGENENATEAQQEPGLAQQEEAPATEAATEQTAAADEGKGVGPVTTVEVGENIDEALAGTGKTLFEGKCSACHQLSDQKVVGPGLAGVTERRKPEWIMNMIINPEEMTKQDPTAKKLLAEHLTQMTNQNVNEQDARALLEFLRKNDKAS